MMWRSENKEKRMLPCKLTSEEWRKNSEKLATTNKTLFTLYRELRQTKAALEALTKISQTNIEHRTVECYYNMDFTKKMVDVVRSDTDEIVETRKMLPYEFTRYSSGVLPGVDIEHPVDLAPMHNEINDIKKTKKEKI